MAGNNSVGTGYGLFNKVVNHNERVLPVWHTRAEMNVIINFSFMRQFIFMGTEGAIDDIYPNASGCGCPWSCRPGRLS